MKMSHSIDYDKEIAPNADLREKIKKVTIELTVLEFVVVHESLAAQRGHDDRLDVIIDNLNYNIEREV